MDRADPCVVARSGAHRALYRCGLCRRHRSDAGAAAPGHGEVPAELSRGLRPVRLSPESRERSIEVCTSLQLSSVWMNARLNHYRASFEMRPLGAPQDEVRL